VALLAWLGCHADSHEQAAWFGDDIALRSDSHTVDEAGPGLAVFILRHIGRGASPWRRARLLASLVGSGGDALAAMQATHCLVAGQFAMRLGLGPDVRDCLHQVFERWDGKGAPAKVKGEQIALPARIVVLADILEVFRRIGGSEAAVDVARGRAGGQFDPGLAEHVCDNAATLFRGIDEAMDWEAVIADEPALRAQLSGVDLDSALEAVADFADLKSPYTTGHSRGVAERAAAAARLAGLTEPAAVELRRAGLLHDIGRLGVSNAI
jgi:hypothetical protein